MYVGGWVAFHTQISLMVLTFRAHILDLFVQRSKDTQNEPKLSVLIYAPLILSRSTKSVDLIQFP